MMNRETLNELSMLISELDSCITDVLIDLDIQNEYVYPGGPKREDPRKPAPGDHFFAGTARTGALRRKSMDVTRKLAEMRKPQ